MPSEFVPIKRTKIMSGAEIEGLTRDLLGRIPELRQRLHELGSTPSIDPVPLRGSTKPIPSDITFGSVRSRLWVQPTM